MTAFTDTPDDEFTETTDGMKALRKAREKAIKERDALAERVAKYEAAEAQTQIADIFKAKGVNPLAAEFYHGEDKSEAAVTAWVEKFKEVLPSFTPEPTAPAEGEQQAPGSTPETPAIDPSATTAAEQQAIAVRMAALNAGGIPTAGKTLQQLVQETTDPAQLDALLAAAGMSHAG